MIVYFSRKDHIELPHDLALKNGNEGLKGWWIAPYPQYMDYIPSYDSMWSVEAAIIDTNILYNLYKNSFEGVLETL